MSLESDLGNALGTDLSTLRVHTGASSADAAASINARAYTTGSDIHFGAGHYAPSTTQGQELIAHEAAHTVQQRGATSPAQTKTEISTPGDAGEVEADAFAAAFVGGDAVPAVTPGMAASVQRDPAAEDAAAGDTEPKTGPTTGSLQAPPVDHAPFKIASSTEIDVDGMPWYDIVIVVTHEDLAQWIAAAPNGHLFSLAGVPVRLRGVTGDAITVRCPVFPEQLVGGQLSTNVQGTPEDWLMAMEPSADPEPDVSGPITNESTITKAVNFHRTGARTFNFEWVAAIQAELGVTATGAVDRATVQGIARHQIANTLATLDDEDVIGRAEGDTLASLEGLVEVTPSTFESGTEFEQTLSDDPDQRAADIATMTASAGDSEAQDLEDLEEHSTTVSTKKKVKKREERAKTCGIPSWEEGGLKAILNEVNDAEFLGRTYVAHPLLIDRMNRAQSYLESETGLQGKELRKHLGMSKVAALRDGWSYHGLGFAVDLDPGTNPFVGGEQFEVEGSSRPLRNAARYRSNCEFVRAVWHAVWFWNEGIVLTNAKLAQMRGSMTTEEIFTTLQSTSNALKRFLALRNTDVSEISTSSVASPPPGIPAVHDMHKKMRDAIEDEDTIDPELEHVIASVQADIDSDAATLGDGSAADWQAVAAADYERLTTLSAEDVQTLIDESTDAGETKVAKKAQKKLDEGSVEKASRKIVNANFITGADPDDGFMTLTNLVVRAMRDVAGLAWGATDFAGENELGDIQHFDLRSDPRINKLISG